MSNFGVSAKESQRQIGVVDVAIIGSGFAGLCMGIRLKQEGLDNFLILEKADRLGGTWRDNTYPGAACDIPSFLYSYSFEQKKDWSQKYAGQPEILAYLEHCAQKYSLHERIRFNTEIAKASFDELEGLWNVVTVDGQQIQTRILVSACGQLHHPSVPNFPGLNDFKGKKFHSARWDHNYRLEGKTIAVVGNGASAIQLIPHVAQRAKKLIVFQRSPHWVRPKGRQSFTLLEKWFNENVPGAPSLRRFFTFLSTDIRFRVFLQGTPSGKLLRRSLRKKIVNRVHDAELRDALIPDYEVGCKRILLSNEYYDVLQQENVNLITQSIDSIDETGIKTKTGQHHPVDAIIFGTGFRANDFLFPMDIEGLNGASLSSVWKDGAEAYYGMMVSKFPNLFMLFGPNTSLGHNSIIFMIESQVNCIIKLMRSMQERDAQYLDVKDSVMTSHNQSLQESMDRLVWNAQCMSWYKNKAGKIVNNWPDFAGQYRWQTRRIKPENFNYYRVTAPVKGESRWSVSQKAKTAGV